MFSAIIRSASPYVFSLMFGIVLLLNINYTILRSLRNTLAVVDLGTGAHSIPIFELFGALPGALFMTWGLGRLMQRYSIKKVFLITLAIFLGFFLFFTFGLYPFLALWKQQGEISNVTLQFLSMSFFVMGELWKPALATILFWGLINQHVPLAQAKDLYAPLILGGSLGGVVAGPLVSACTSETVWKWFSLSSERWTHAFTLMILVISLIGGLTAYLYYLLWNHFEKNPKEKNSEEQITNSKEIINPPPKKAFSLKDNLSTCFHTPYLRLLSWIVVADYIAYSLGEVIFLDVLKHKFPEPHDYCNYMGHLSLWGSVVTVICALFVTPAVIQRCRWVIAALATPICLFIIGGSFFMLLLGREASEAWFGWTESQWIGIVVVVGSLQYCLCRGAKNTLFETSKELAFVWMPDVQKMKGKLVIDGICARLGRGGASALSIFFIQISGGVLASSLLTGIVAVGVALSCVLTTSRLGKLIDHKWVKPALQEN